jgi:nucleotide-binding universal stress UspA family protein
MASQNNGSATSLPRAVVVALDFDVTGDNALRAALSYAEGRDDVEIHVVHAIAESRNARHKSGLDNVTQQLDAVPKKLRTYLAAKQLEMPQLGRRRVSIHARVGAPAEAIVQVAVDVKAELIVAGTHGRRGLKKLALGSVATRLIEIAHCPVLIARPTEYEGLAVSSKPEPLCPDCAKAREESEGEQLWCEFHRRPHVRPHVLSYTEVFAVGGHDPGIVAG